MAEEEYTIIPHKEISELKTELEKLKKNPNMVDNSLRTSLDNLNGALAELMGVFKEATQEMRLEEGEETILNKKLTPLLERMDVIIDQNQKIAEGIVALADIMKGVPERTLRGINAREEKEGRDSAEGTGAQAPWNAPPYPQYPQQGMNWQGQGQGMMGMPQGMGGMSGMGTPGGMAPTGNPMMGSGQNYEQFTSYDSTVQTIQQDNYPQGYGMQSQGQAPRGPPPGMGGMSGMGTPGGMQGQGGQDPFGSPFGQAPAFPPPPEPAPPKKRSFFGF